MTDSVITGNIVSIKHGNGAPGTLAHFDSGFELVIDSGDDGLFVLTANDQSVRGGKIVHTKLRKTSLCCRCVLPAIFRQGCPFCNISTRIDTAMENDDVIDVTLLTLISEPLRAGEVKVGQKKSCCQS
jgi:hypothetical protein